MNPAPLPSSIRRIKGVRFTEQEFDAIMTNRISFREIMEFRNIEKRRAAIEYIGLNALIQGGFHLLDKSERGNRLYVSDEPYETKYSGVGWIFFLAYECPSTWRRYVSPVDGNEIIDRLDEKMYLLAHAKLMAITQGKLKLCLPKVFNGFLADSAMAWKFSLTVDEYRSMTAEA